MTRVWESVVKKKKKTVLDKTNKGNINFRTASFIFFSASTEFVFKDFLSSSNPFVFRFNSVFSFAWNSSSLWCSRLTTSSSFTIVLEGIRIGKRKYFVEWLEPFLLRPTGLAIVQNFPPSPPRHFGGTLFLLLICE